MYKTKIISLKKSGLSGPCGFAGQQIYAAGTGRRGISEFYQGERQAERKRIS
jgi:hypothetical protein